MNALCTTLLAIACVAPLALTLGGETRPNQDLQPRPVTFSKDRLPLRDALKELQEQTGNPIKDLRQPPTNPVVNTKPGLFWPTLDALGKQTGIGFSAYHPGGVALVNTPYCELQHIDYHGIFRFAVTGIAVSRNEETQTHQCQVTLDVAWEPRFQALFLNLEKAAVDFGRASEKIDRQTARSVSGKSAAEVELRMKAPPRAVAEIASLKGTIRVVGVPHMLDFAFPKLKPKMTASAKLEGVTVRVPVVEITMVNKKPSRISVDVESEYPAGALIRLDSFQNADLMNNNRLWLTWGTDPKTKKPYELDPSDAEAPEELASGMRRTFHFTPRGDVPLPPNSADVTLHYRTPSRVSAYTASFEVKKIALP